MGEMETAGIRTTKLIFGSWMHPIHPRFKPPCYPARANDNCTPTLTKATLAVTTSIFIQRPHAEALPGPAGILPQIRTVPRHAARLHAQDLSQEARVSHCGTTLSGKQWCSTLSLTTPRLLAPCGGNSREHYFHALSRRFSGLQSSNAPGIVHDVPDTVRIRGLQNCDSSTARCAVCFCR